MRPVQLGDDVIETDEVKLAAANPARPSLECQRPASTGAGPGRGAAVATRGAVWQGVLPAGPWAAPRGAQEPMPLLAVRLLLRLAATNGAIPPPVLARWSATGLAVASARRASIPGDERVVCYRKGGEKREHSINFCLSCFVLRQEPGA